MSSLKIGDIVSCGWSGWFRVVSLSENINSTYGRRVVVQLVMNKKGVVIKNTKKTWETNEKWCSIITLADIKKLKESDIKKWDILTLMVDPNQDVDNKEDIIIKEEVIEPEYLTLLGPPASLIIKK